MAIQFYILNERGQPRRAGQKEFEHWFNSADGVHVLCADHVDSVFISTIFLGHAFEDHRPVLWETKVFGGRLDQVSDRCAGDADQARAMHAQMLSRVRNSTYPNT